MWKVRADSVTWQVVDDEIVCLDLSGSQYFSINAAGAVLWPQLVEGAETAALVESLMSTYDIDHATASSDVAAYVASLRQRDLLESV